MAWDNKSLQEKTAWLIGYYGEERFKKLFTWHYTKLIEKYTPLDNAEIQAINILGKKTEFYHPCEEYKSKRNMKSNGN